MYAYVKREVVSRRVAAVHPAVLIAAIFVISCDFVEVVIGQMLRHLVRDAHVMKRVMKENADV